MTEAWPLQRAVLLDGNGAEVESWTGYAVPEWIRGLPNENACFSYVLVIGKQRIQLPPGDLFAEIWEVLQRR